MMGFRKEILEFLNGYAHELNNILRELVRSNQINEEIVKALAQINQRQAEVARLQLLMTSAPRPEESYNPLADEELIGLEVEGIEDGTD